MDQRKLTKALRKAGWHIARESNHTIWRCSCGDHTLVVPKSASDHRTVKNLLRDLRKMGACNPVRR